MAPAVVRKLCCRQASLPLFPQASPLTLHNLPALDLQQNTASFAILLLWKHSQWVSAHGYIAALQNHPGNILRVGELCLRSLSPDSPLSRVLRIADLIPSSFLQFLVFITLKDFSILCGFLFYKITSNLKCGLSIKAKGCFKQRILHVPTFPLFHHFCSTSLTVLPEWKIKPRRRNRAANCHLRRWLQDTFTDPLC